MGRMKRVAKWLAVLYFNIIGLGFIWLASVPTTEALSIVSSLGVIVCLLFVMVMTTEILGFWTT